jgi:ectoine synthase
MLIRTLSDLIPGIGEIRTPQWSSHGRERHRLQVTKRMRVICTFVPPLVGGEIHDSDGAYPG